MYTMLKVQKITQNDFFRVTDTLDESSWDVDKRPVSNLTLQIFIRKTLYIVVVLMEHMGGTEQE